MATITHAGTTYNTTAGNKTQTSTPAVNDLIVVICASSGIAGGTTNVTDDNSSGTYTQIGADATFSTNTRTLEVWVRNALIGSAVSTIYTATQASSTGGGLVVLRVSGMTRTGSSAVLTSGSQSEQAAGTPAPVLSATPQAGNPVIAAMQNLTNPPAHTARAGYTEDFDNGYNTPGSGLYVQHIASGETSATITWATASGTGFCSYAVELDTSALGTGIVVPSLSNMQNFLRSR